MAFLSGLIGKKFDSSEVEPQTEMGALPEGWYEVMITESAIETTKKGGQALKLVYQVLDDGFNGRLAWDRLNLVNDNPTAVQIAERALSAICRAVGVGVLDDTTDLHEKPFGVKLTYVPPQGEYREKNEIKGYCLSREIAEKRLNGRKGAAPKAPVAVAPAPKAPVATAPSPRAPVAAAAKPPLASTKAPAPGMAAPWRRNGAEATKQEAQQDDVRA